MSPKEVKLGGWYIIASDKHIRHYFKLGTKVKVVDNSQGSCVHVTTGEVWQNVSTSDLVPIPITLCNYDKPDYVRPLPDSYRRFYVLANPKMGLPSEHGFLTSTDRLRGRKIDRPRHLQVVYVLPYPADDAEEIQSYDGRGFWFRYLGINRETGEEEVRTSYGNVNRFLPLFGR